MFKRNFLPLLPYSLMLFSACKMNAPAASEETIQMPEINAISEITDVENRPSVFRLEDHIRKINFEKEVVTTGDLMMIDTLDGNWRIALLRQPTEKIFEHQGCKYPYLDLRIHLEYKDKTILEKVIDGPFFIPYMPDDIAEFFFTDHYDLYYCGIVKIENDSIVLDTNVCMPDSDICSMFDLIINPEGSISVIYTGEAYENMGWDDDEISGVGEGSGVENAETDRTVIDSIGIG